MFTVKIQADFRFSDLSEPQAKSRQDQRKFGDLSHREASQEASSAPIAHHAHDRHHDQRVANQHKQPQQFLVLSQAAQQW